MPVLEASPVRAIAAFVLSIVLVSHTIGIAQSNLMSKSIDVPFSLLGNYPIAQVLVNGEGPFSMVLDTGATTSTLDQELASRLRLSISRHSRTILAVRHHGPAKRTELAKVQLGDLSREKVEAYVWEIAPEDRLLVDGLEIPGVLGNTFLSQWIVQFDYANGRVRFCDPDVGWIPRGRGIRFRGDLFVDNVMLNGRPFTAMVDTGSPLMFSVPPRPAKALNLQPVVPGNPIAFLDSAVIGTLSFQDASAVLIERGTGFDAAKFVNIGNVLLKRFVFTIDYKRKVLHLDPPGGNSDFCQSRK